MLINIRISELQSNTSNSIPLSAIIAILFNYSLFQLLPYDGGTAILSTNSSIGASSGYINNLLYGDTINSNTSSKFSISYFDNINMGWRGSPLNEDILFVTSNLWDGNLAENSHITTIGNVMYTNYNIWLIIASFILLLAMVGAIVITIKQKN